MGLLRTSFEWVLPSREAGVCRLEKTYSLLGEGKRPHETDRPGSPLQNQVAWRLAPPHMPCTLASGHLQPSAWARPPTSSLWDQLPSLSLSFLVFPPLRLN